MSVKTVDAMTLKNWLEKEEAILIDVRDPAEYQAENIPGSILIPLLTISQKKLPDIGDKKLVVHCGLGKRGAKACEKLVAEDPSLDVYNLEGGLSAWSQQGNVVNKGRELFLPLDRQVQFTMGLAVLIGTLLGFFVHPIFLIIPVFLGAGLSYAGWTGDSYLEKGLIKMPWNQH